MWNTYCKCQAPAAHWNVHECHWPWTQDVACACPTLQWTHMYITLSTFGSKFVDGRSTHNISKLGYKISVKISAIICELKRLKNVRFSERLSWEIIWAIIWVKIALMWQDYKSEKVLYYIEMTNQLPIVCMLISLQNWWNKMGNTSRCRQIRKQVLWE